MKYCTRILLLSLFLLLSAQAKAQSEQVRVKPDISYTSNHQSYILGGLTVNDIKGYDQEYLLNISGLEVGQAYEIPGPDISEAIQKYWAQKLFSNVQITADSIVGNQIFLHIELTAQPRISAINYKGVKKSEREDCEKMIGLQTGSQINTDIINRAKYYIKKHFEDKGFNNCEVEIMQREDVTGDNKVIVDININKN